MKTTKRRDSRTFATVERAEEGGPPTAFLIWHDGDNVTDHGPTVFSKRSARLLLEEQETRGNRYSMDVNHLSLNPDAPLENQRAVGFFSLEVRDGGLWATDCEWTDTVRDGLVKSPPEWKYFSPAYDVDQDTGEVVSFLNCALTNNPATHHVTALATRGAKDSTPMKYADIIAALNGEDGEKKDAAIAAMKEAFGEDEDPKNPKKEEMSKDSADEAPPSSKAPKKDGEMPEKKGDDSAGDGSEGEPKSSKDASITAALDAKVRKLETQLATFTEERIETERKSLIAGRTMSAELAKVLAKKPLAEVAEICATLPRKSPKDLAAETRVTATRGADQGERTSRLPADERAQMDARMGLATKKAAVRRDGRAQTFDTLTPADAKRILATKKDSK